MKKFILSTTAAVALMTSVASAATNIHRDEGDPNDVIQHSSAMYTPWSGTNGSVVQIPVTRNGQSDVWRGAWPAHTTNPGGHTGGFFRGPDGNYGNYVFIKRVDSSLSQQDAIREARDAAIDLMQAAHETHDGFVRDLSGTTPTTNNFGSFDLTVYTQRGGQWDADVPARPTANDPVFTQARLVDGNGVYRVRNAPTSFYSVTNFQAASLDNDTISGWTTSGSAIRTHPITRESVPSQTRDIAIKGQPDGTFQFERDTEWVKHEYTYNSRDPQGPYGTYLGSSDAVPDVPAEASIRHIRTTFTEDYVALAQDTIIYTRFSRNPAAPENIISTPYSTTFEQGNDGSEDTYVIADGFERVAYDDQASLQEAWDAANPYHVAYRVEFTSEITHREDGVVISDVNIHKVNGYSHQNNAEVEGSLICQALPLVDAAGTAIPYPDLTSTGLCVNPNGYTNIPLTITLN